VTTTFTTPKEKYSNFNFCRSNTLFTNKTLQLQDHLQKYKHSWDIFRNWLNINLIKPTWLTKVSFSYDINLTFSCVPLHKTARWNRKGISPNLSEYWLDTKVTPKLWLTRIIVNSIKAKKSHLKKKPKKKPKRW